MGADSSSTKRKGQGVTNATFSSLGSFVKLLPTGTVFVFQFVNPAVTNSGGECNATNKWLSSILLVVCGLSCALSSFTDSYVVDGDDKRHYGFVTSKGLWPNPEPEGSNKVKNLERGDFVHAALSLLVFAVLGLLDINTVGCLYGGFETTQKTLLQVLPTAIGVLAGVVFMIYPINRNGIGYPASLDTSSKSKDTVTAPPQNPINNV